MRSTGGNTEQACATGAHTEPVFQLRGSLCQLHAQGCRKRLTPGPAATLGKRTAAFFAAQETPSRPLVGMLPFDPFGDSALYQPHRVRHLPPAVPSDPVLPGRAAIPIPEPAPEHWQTLVEQCAAHLARRDDAREQLHKVVLARELHLRTHAPVESSLLARRLGDDPGATTYIAPLPKANGQPPAWLVGASPELLISRRGDSVVSNPLAGSAPRHADADADNAAAEQLLASAKDQDEHRYVVEAISDTLAPYCDELHVPTEPALQATRTMWHLGSRIEGRLEQPQVSAAELAGRLHPTPAVCGTPREPALDTIQRLEPTDRGFYAGAVGWANAAGDGDWYVAIRCARVQDRDIRLYAGAGILADSIAAHEVAETEAKFAAMLNALGVEQSPHCSREEVHP